MKKGNFAYNYVHIDSKRNNDSIHHMMKTSKLLVLTADTDLPWTDYIIKLIKKHNSSEIYEVKRIIRIGGIETSNIAYYSYIYITNIH